jgi:predicted RNA methylase
MTETLAEKCKRLEHWETPEWTINAILKKEILTEVVWDPCCGAGVMSRIAKEHGYHVISSDIHNWGYEDQKAVIDFLDQNMEIEESYIEASVLMNPPFSKAQSFVERAFELGARKVVCFQRFAWWESASRQEFWKKYPPNRIYICSDRADCWRHDIQPGPDGKRRNPETGKAMESTPTAHAYFVWEVGHPAGTLVGHISKKDAA